MAIKKLIVDMVIENIANINSTDKIGFQINKNFENLTHSQGEKIIDKEFVKDGFSTIDNYVEVTDNKVTNQIGTVDGSIAVVETFNHKGVDLIALGGAFSSYTYNGVVTTVQRMVVLNADGSINKIPNLFDNTDIIEDIKYHQGNETLIVGGNFAVGTINGLIEYDIDTNDLSASMASWDTSGSIGGTANNNINSIAIRQSTGSIYVAGAFETISGYALSNIARLRSDFKFDTGYGFAPTVGTNLSGTVNTIKVSQEGVVLIYVGGDFSFTRIFDNSVYTNFVVLDLLGRVAYPDSFKSTDKIVRDLDIDDNGYIYLIGNDMSYGDSASQSVFKLSPGGVIQNYNPTFVDRNMRSIAVSTDLIYVSSETLVGKIAKLESFDGSGNRLGGFELSGSVRDIQKKPNTEKTFIIAGGFTEFKPNLQSLSENQILVGVNNIETATNLFDNLQLHNQLSDNKLTYLINGNTVTLEYILDENDVTFLSNIDEKVNAYSVTETRNDGSFIDKINLVNVRRDLVIFGGNNPASTRTEFEIGNIESLVNGDTSENIFIRKPRVSTDVSNNYINLSRLVPKDKLIPELSYYLNMLRVDINNQPIVKRSNHGQFVNVNSAIFDREVNLNSQNVIYLTTDGYNYNENIKGDKILLNGKRRQVLRGKRISIPFKTYDFDSIEIGWYNK